MNPKAGASNSAPKNKKRKIIILLLVILLLGSGLAFAYIRDFGPIGHALHSLVDKIKGTSLVANLDSDAASLGSDKSSKTPGSDTSDSPTDATPSSKPAPTSKPSQSNPKIVIVPTPKPTPASPKPSPKPTPLPAPGPSAPNCVVDSAHPNLQDQAEAVMKAAWRRTIPYKVSIYYETKNVPANIKALMTTGASQWNSSACLDVHVVHSCPSNVNCVQSKMGGASPDNTHAGKATLTIKGNHIVGAKITYYDGYKESTVPHEMGHALGLMGHRSTPNTLLHHISANVPPDDIDFQNLLVLYGSK